MPRPQKVALQRCLLFGNALRGVEDAAPYMCKCRFFDKLTLPPALRPGESFVVKLQAQQL